MNLTPSETLFCREGYAGVAGVLPHLSNVGVILNEMLTISDRYAFPTPIRPPANSLAVSLAHYELASFQLTCSTDHVGQPDGATLSGPSAEVAEADRVQSTGTKVGLFWEAME